MAHRPSALTSPPCAKNGINILDGIRDSITDQAWQPAPG